MNRVAKIIKWNDDKNKWLQKNRNITFEEVLLALSNKQNILAYKKHYNQNDYSNQKILIINISNYAYLIPPDFGYKIL